MMYRPKVVIALGGNALGNTPEEQLCLVRNTAASIVDLFEEGYRVVIGHGNGPQAGMIQNAMNFSNQHGGETPEMPLAECGAMSQGYIGYHLQQAVQNELQKRSLSASCVSLVTQVVVDENDPGFTHPTKPVGSFYTKEQAAERAAREGSTYIEDAGRGWRRVVPSPMPQRIVEIDTIRELSENGNIVIAAGGGGIPVIEKEDGLQGAAAVIDKDNSCARMAIELNADFLVILTGVEKVCINYNKPNMKGLDTMTVAEAQQYIGENQFAPGSMLPKVEACIRYVQATGHKAMITALDRVKDGLAGRTGTIITQ